MGNMGWCAICVCLITAFLGNIAGVSGCQYWCHTDGRKWRAADNTVKLNSGTEFCVTYFNSSNVSGYPNYSAVYVNGNSNKTLTVSSAGNLLSIAPFSANTAGFSFALEQSTTAAGTFFFSIPSGSKVSYQASGDELRLAGNKDSKIVSWVPCGCQSSSSLPYLDTTTWLCVAACGAGNYLNASDNRCYVCNSECSACVVCTGVVFRQCIKGVCWVCGGDTL
eukprot:GDKI01018219.1.p1 GENE.GDKI01018219.1~~GDKI01018219.1.p1  ORF type:complete len:222 (+),score=31.86 GDKI01018219.1:164-829(+)